MVLSTSCGQQGATTCCFDTFSFMVGCILNCGYIEGSLEAIRFGRLFISGDLK